MCFQVSNLVFLLFEICIKKMYLYNDLVEDLNLSYSVYIRVISSLFSNELYGLDCVKYLPVV